MLSSDGNLWWNRHYGSNKYINASIISQTESTIGHIGIEFDILIDDFSAAISQLAKDEDVIDVLMEKEGASEYKVNHKMFLVNRGNSTNANIYVVSSTRGYSLSTAGETPISYMYPYNKDWGVFRKANTIGSIGIHTSDKGVTSNRNALLTIAHGVWDRQGENLIGYVVVDILRSGIMNLVSSYLDTYHTSIMIVDAFGNVMFHSLGTDYEGIGRLKLCGVDSIPTNEDRLGPLTRGNKVYRRSELTNYTIIGEISMDLLSSNIKVFKLATLIATAMVSLLGVIFAYIIARNVTKPINILVKSMKKVEKGDLGIQIKMNRRDEIGVLGDTFNSMTVQIKTHKGC